MRVLITGANGQVGHELLRVLAGSTFPLSRPSPVKEDVPTSFRARVAASNVPFETKGVAAQRREDGAPGYEVVTATRAGFLENGNACERIDLADPAGLTLALERLKPDLIINAAAYTAVDRAEAESELAQRVNGDALRVLGEWAARHAARVVHYSTDYVFDGRATRPYIEADPAHPVSVYGRTKLAGELALRASGARHLILRTAWVYAARGKNFLRTMLRLGAERGELRVVDDQIGAPTPAGLIADVTAAVVSQWGRDADAARDGVYHLVAGGQTSWCGFARAIFERAAVPRIPASQAKGETKVTSFGTKGVEAQPRGDASAPCVVAITTADYPTPAARPAWSVLDTSKLRQTFKIELPSWQTALDGVMAELAARSRQR